jgi:5'-nucleotidase
VKGDKVRVLLTNDDGVRAAGLLAIRAALTDWCGSVITVAPASDCSGFARKATFDRPVEVRRLEGGQHPVYECDGTPADCVRVGLLGGLAADASLVVSGVNHGGNLADDVVYSGTVGAGLEAAVLGTSALCLSQQTPPGGFPASHAGEPGHGDEPGGRLPSSPFSLASRHGGALARSICAARLAEPVVLNVNYPAVPARASPGAEPPVRLTRPGQRVYPRASMRDWDSGPAAQHLYLFGEADEIPAADGEPDTDMSAVRAGCISVTPLSITVGLDELTPAVTALLAPLVGVPGRPVQVSESRVAGA